MENRIRSRRREVRWLRFRSAALLGAAAVGAGLASYGYFGPIFRVQGVALRGAPAPIAAELRARLASSLSQYHVWSISPRLVGKSIAGGVLGDEVRVDRVSVSPPAGLVITVSPVAPVARIGAGIGVVPSGVVVPLAIAGGGLPFLSVCPEPLASVGSRCTARLTAGERIPGVLLAPALAATRSAPGARLVDVRGKGVVAILQGGGVCTLGSSGQAASKLGLCVQLARKNATVDLRGADSPALVVG